MGRKAVEDRGSVFCGTTRSPILRALRARAGEGGPVLLPFPFSTKPLSVYVRTQTH